MTSRRINWPVDALTAALDSPGTLRRGTALELGGGGVLVVDGPFRESWCWPRSEWRTTACLYHGRNRPVARLQLTVAAWSRDASELSLRPVAKHPERWGRRRTQRYFALAHDAADKVSAHLRDTELTLRQTSARPLVGTTARSLS